MVDAMHCKTRSSNVSALKGFYAMVTCACNVTIHVSMIMRPRAQQLRISSMHLNTLLAGQLPANLSCNMD